MVFIVCMITIIIRIDLSNVFSCLFFHIWLHWQPVNLASGQFFDIFKEDGIFSIKYLKVFQYFIVNRRKYR